MNNIRIERDALCGNTIVPPGEYTVSVRADTRQINLEGQGRDIELNAVGRPTKGVVRSLAVQFSSSGGGNCWTLVVKTPKMGEYMAEVTYEEKKKH